MKQVYEYTLNNILKVYEEDPHNEETGFDETLGYDAKIVIVTDFEIKRSDMWEWVQNKYGTVPGKCREDVTPTLVQLVDGIFGYVKSLPLYSKDRMIKLVGSVHDEFGDLVYTKETEWKDRIAL